MLNYLYDILLPILVQWLKILNQETSVNLDIIGSIDNIGRFVNRSAQTKPTLYAVNEAPSLMTRNRTGILTWDPRWQVPMLLLHYVQPWFSY
jgi:hypothetical protein